MSDFKITLTPEKNGSVRIHLQGRDDSGHLLDTWVTSPNHSSVAGVIEATLRSLQTVASTITEEEDFDEKRSK